LFCARGKYFRNNIRNPLENDFISAPEEIILEIISETLLENVYATRVPPRPNRGQKLDARGKFLGVQTGARMLKNRVLER